MAVIPLAHAPLEAGYKNWGTDKTSAGSFRTRAESVLRFTEIAAILGLVVPNGASGVLLGGTNLQILPPPETTPSNSYFFDATFPNVLVLAEDFGRVLVGVNIEFEVLGNPGQLTWTHSGEIGPRGAFTKAMPDPPIGSFQSRASTSNQDATARLVGRFGTVFPFPNGLEALNRITHSGGGPITINISTLAITQEGRGAGPEIRGT